MQENEQPRIIATCPVCKKLFVADGKERLILSQYMIKQGQQGSQMHISASLPKIACTGCGVEFFTEESLIELRKKAAGEAKSIIIPKTMVKLN